MMPLYPDTPGNMLREELLLDSENSIARIDPGLKDLAGVIKILHVPSVRKGRFLQVYLDGETQMGMGVFGPAAPTPPH